jgi:hypothetical protein
MDAGGVITDIKTDKFMPEDIIKIQKIAERKFMVNPSFLQRRLKMCKSVSDLIAMTKVGLRIMIKNYFNL